jgi:hypothetical protein
MIIGAVGEVFAACDSVVPKYYQWFCQLLAANSGTKDSKINRNIAYAIGILAEHAQLLFSANCADFQGKLLALMNENPDSECKDNIISAMSRIIQF